MRRKIVIAIDGYSGTGKSSTARTVASKLGYRYIDSGAMYRAVTFAFLQHSVDMNSTLDVISALDNIQLDFKVNEVGDSIIHLNGVSVEEKIRTPQVNEKVSAVAALSEVRKKMVAKQQQFGNEKGIVMDGRDIGTVVFPRAELKIFMTAAVAVRAERRKLEMEQSGIYIELKEVEKNLIERDQKDTTRADSPLIKASDAIEIDTSDLTFIDQVNKIVEQAELIINS